MPLPALPRWLAVTDVDGQRCAGLVILAGVVLGAGVLATPRNDITGEIRELLASLRSSAVLRTVIRTSLFLGRPRPGASAFTASGSAGSGTPC